MKGEKWIWLVAGAVVLYLLARKSGGGVGYYVAPEPAIPPAAQPPAAMNVIPRPAPAPYGASTGPAFEDRSGRGHF